MKKSILFLSIWITQAWALSCSKPVTLSESEGIYLSPKVKLNEKGEALVAWQAVTPEETFYLQAARRDVEKRWSKAEMLGGLEEKISPPHVHMTSEGNAYVGWWCRKDEEVFYKFSKETQGSWCPAITVANSEDLKEIRAISFDVEGNPLILGMRDQPNAREMGVIHYHHATAKKDYKTLSTNADIFPFQIVRNPQGQAAILWAAPRKNWYFRKSDYDVQQLKLSEDGEWLAPTTLCKLGMMDINKEHVAHLFSSMNSKGSTALIWVDWNDEVEGMKVVVAPEKPGGSPIVLAASRAGFCSPKILIDDQDNTLAVWIGLLKNRRAVFAAYKPQGQPWTSPVPLSHSQKHADKFELRQDYQGHFVVVWGESSFNFETLIYGAVFSTQTQEWSLTLLSPEDQICADPSIAFNQKGEGIIAWSNLLLDQKQFTIQAAELKID